MTSPETNFEGAPRLVVNEIHTGCGEVSYDDSEPDHVWFLDLVVFNDAGERQLLTLIVPDSGIAYLAAQHMLHNGVEVASGTPKEVSEAILKLLSAGNN